MADADRLRISYSAAESTYGTHPGGTLKDMRILSEGLVFESDFQPSQQLRDDRQVADVIRMAARSSGNLACEMSYGTHDDLMQYGLFSGNWSSPVTVGPLTTIAAVATTNKYTRSSGSFVTDGIVAGQWIKVSGFVTAANNGYCKVISVAALEIVVTGLVLVNESVGPSVTIYMGAQILNGTTKNSVSIEKQYTDLSNEFEIFKGMLIAQMQMGVVAKQIMTASFQLMGADCNSATASSGSGYTAANTNAVLAAVSDIQKVMIGQSTSAIGTTKTTGFDWTINNNLRDRTNVGNLIPESYGAGKASVNLNVRQYYESKTLWDYYRNNTPKSVAYIVLDAAGNAYAVDFPNVRWTGARRVAGGENSDIIGEHTAIAHRHATEGVTVRIARFPAS